MDIIKNRKIYIGISLLLIIIGFGFMIYNYSIGKGAFNYDIQFTGGTSIQVNIGKDFNNNEIAEIVTSSTDEKSPQIQKLGSEDAVIIKTKSLDQETRKKLVDALCTEYEITDESISIEDVSATISGEMKQTAILAVVVSCIAMLVYVSVRFRDFKTGASSIIALLHDALIMLACYAVFRIPLNNSFIAAVLTILGYSINASIVIFDRVRENKKRNFTIKDDELINSSVNQSLRRSVFTSLTTFFTIASLYVFGVQSVKEFAFPIVIGIVCGTYSSVFIAGSVWYTLSNFKKAKTN